MQDFNEKSEFLSKNPTIKGKIMLFSATTGVKIATIAEAMNVSKSNFRGKNIASSLNAEAVARFLINYPSVSADWLMRDEGPMLKTETGESLEQNINNGVNVGHIGSEHHINVDPEQSPNCDTCQLLKAKQETIDAQRIAINALMKKQ
jgi:hypothetical protein